MTSIGITERDGASSARDGIASTYQLSSCASPSLITGFLACSGQWRRDVSTRSADALQGFHGDPDAVVTPCAAFRGRPRAGTDAYEKSARYPSSHRSRALDVPLKRALKRRMGRARGSPRGDEARASTTDLLLPFVRLTQSNAR